MAQASFDLVVHAVGIVRTGAFTNAKELHQLSLEPQPGGCRGEQRKVLRKAAPDGSSPGLGWTTATSTSSLTRATDSGRGLSQCMSEMVMPPGTLAA